MLTCVFSGGAAAFGLYLLSRAATKTPHRRSSFFAVAELTYPKAAIFFDAAIAIKCFGVSIRWAVQATATIPGVNPLHFSYLIIIKSLMPNVVAAIHHDIASPDTRLPDWALSERVWICLIMLILAPLSFLRHLDSLRHTSFIALFAVGTRINPKLPGGCADRKFLISVSCHCCGLWLFQPHGRCSRTRRDPPHSLYPCVRVNFPGPSVCFHLCPERKFGSLFRRCLYSHYYKALPDLQ